MLRRTARIVLEAGFDPVYVVLGAQAQDILPCLDGLSVQVLPNEAWEEGMASSIRRGISSLAPDIQAVLLALSDQPGR